ncbi:MAG: hypothetical protein ACJAZ2_001701 [Glaciecola sp.]|jgi:hypothetical protein
MPVEGKALPLQQRKYKRVLVAFFNKTLFRKNSGESILI